MNNPWNKGDKIEWGRKQRKELREGGMHTKGKYGEGGMEKVKLEK